MKILITIFIAGLLWCSCSRGKYYVSHAFRNGVPDHMEIMTLDTSYRFYVRQVYKDKNTLKDIVLQSNLDADTLNKTRVEVEYLLLSLYHKTAIYISTIPDKYQRYYSTFNFGDSLLNAYDFSTFYFGEVNDDGEGISFESKKKRKVMIWDIRPFINGSYPEKLSIREIAVQQDDILENVILINKALEEPLVFNLQKNFNIIFEKPAGRGETIHTANSLCKSLDHKIYFRRYDHGFTIYFRFDRPVAGSKDSAIGFDYTRTRYPPAAIK